FLVFLTFVMRLLQPLKQLSQIPAVAQNAFAAAERLFDVIDRPTEKALDQGTRVVDGFRHALVFDDVGFAYERDRCVLADISFTAKKGDVIAIVGASGAGKTTLVDLIPRFYEPTVGRIMLDGVDTRAITLGPVHRRADRSRGPRGQRAPVHRRAAARLRHSVRRARHAALGRPAPAHRDRAGA